jgi:hypothetical protein
LIVLYAKWLFSEPRLIPAVGGRGDLAKRISGDDLGDRPTVYVDPETLMPLPRALRQQLLEDMLNNGRISLAEYQKRSVYADVRNLSFGDTDQWGRAQWINTQIEEQWETLEQMVPEERYNPMVPGAIPVLYQDVQQSAPQAQEGAQGPASQMPAMYTTVHKVALLEIILDERRPWGMRQVAIERWGIYDQLERALNDPTGMVPLPLEVTGVPQDKVQQIVMAQQQNIESMAGGGQEQGGQQAAPSNTAAPMVSPSPTNAPMMDQASKLPTPSLTQADVNAAQAGQQEA